MSMERRPAAGPAAGPVRRRAPQTGGGIDFGAVVGGATVGAHIDAYEIYNLLVGESDGGSTLPERAFEDLKLKARRALEDGRLFVSWRHRATRMDCVNVGPHSKCFCGHSYKAHEWWQTQSCKPACRVPGCRCGCFDYVAARGSVVARCTCKHEVGEHRRPDGKRGKCGKCACGAFAPAARCTCGALATEHSTAIENEHRRAADGRTTAVLWDAPGSTMSREMRDATAAAGGLTSFTSLAPGVERAALHPSLALPASSAGRGRGQAHSGVVRRSAPPSSDRASNYEAFIDSLGQ
ncbi:hypothetical protein M885DRAFT_610819 [Pelagophyceae sp. CCMP2097]|nr:hypothetical protein M885DRAFT_610819 [Pelagophyceae sp. CCMP2097]